MEGLLMVQHASCYELPICERVIELRELLFAQQVLFVSHELQEVVLLFALQRLFKGL